MAVVYRITNNLTGKSYVGQTIFSVEQRWRAHLSSMRQGSKWRFHAALRKYGPDVWRREVIFESDDIDEVKRIEEKIITEEDLTNSGYNSKPGGCGGDIVKRENREKWLNNLSDSLKGEKNPRFNGVTNEQLVELMVRYYNENGRLPGPPTLREFGKTVDVNVPKFFTPFRNWPGIVSRAEEETGVKYDPHWNQKNRKRKRNVEDREAD